MAYNITLFCREGCRPCEVVAPAFLRARDSGKYVKDQFKVRKPSEDDDDEDEAFPVDTFPVLALTQKDTGDIARDRDKKPVAPPLIGGSAIQKGLEKFLRAYATSAPLAFDEAF